MPAKRTCSGRNGWRRAESQVRAPADAHLHVLDAVDGHAGHPHIADHAGVVAVEAPVRGEVEGDCAESGD